jgi:hypothetical protein
VFSWLKRLFGAGYAKHIDPPVVDCLSWETALAGAYSQAAKVPGGFVVNTTGTPSMVPLIPAAKTFLVVAPIPFASAALGTVVIYKSPLVPDDQTVAHRLVSGKVKDGFIPSGDNNRYSEANIRVTADNFRGEVVGIYTFPFVPAPVA